jgi:D-3-phosphoglycerate dehydrogenase
MLRHSASENEPQKIKILITGKLHPVALDLLKNPPQELAPEMPIEVAYFPDCDRATLLHEVADSHVLISRSETDIDREVLAAGQFLSVLSRAAVGYGNIDVEAATEAGVLVLNTPGKNTNSAAELTLGLLLSLIRNIPRAHASTAQGGWNRHQFTGTELLEKTIGIVGLGNVGHRVAKFCRSFDMKVLAYDPYIAEDVFRRHGVERVSTLEELLSQSDILTVHTPLNKETKGMVGEIELRKMRRGSLVLNAARGGIIHEKSLLKLLNEGYIAGAGIDTFDNEPTPLTDLVSHPNVVVTPHIGASTHEAQFRIGHTVACQTLKALRGEIVDTPVNLPHVSVLATESSRRFAVLAEKIGCVAAQICDFNPREVVMQVSADVKPEELQLLRLSAIKGFVSPSSEEYVSYVNAEKLLQKRGLDLRVEMVTSDDTTVRRNGLEIRVNGSAAHERTSVGGVLFGNEHPRLCLINDFLFEIEPDGEMLVLQNHDRPGVIGDVGSFLANNKINIAQFELSRNRRGGMAMSLIRIDETLDPELVVGMRKLPNVIGVKMVSGL